MPRGERRAASPSESASDLGERLFYRTQFGGAAFDLVDAPTKLFIPCGFDLGFMWVETREQFFGKARAIFRGSTFAWADSSAMRSGMGCSGSQSRPFTQAVHEGWNSQ